MSETAQINAAMQELAEVTGVPVEQIELISYAETMDSGTSKFIRNLTKCLEAYTKGHLSEDK